ncbi:MAG TPA: hypothetical protein VHH11_18170 [Gammaproteobacteria bacterium]|jgi:hypothetical protein|nr:hypothetical protein [Gammaproteobacteria bacterium]
MTDEHTKRGPPPPAAVDVDVEFASPPCSMHEFAAELGLQRADPPSPAVPERAMPPVDTGKTGD